MIIIEWALRGIGFAIGVLILLTSVQLVNDYVWEPLRFEFPYWWRKYVTRKRRNT
jgi:hypothetical protein